MGLDIDYLFGKNALEELEQILSNKKHGKRKKIANDICKFAEKMKAKHLKK